MDYTTLSKLPTYPAARILTQNAVALDTPLDAPTSATAAELLTELAQKDAPLDMLQLLAHVLPAREATWWACLSARDLLGERLTPCVKAAEAWVLRPGPQTRLAARHALDEAPGDDDTVFAAMAASFADGTMGPGEFEDYPAPPGAVGHVVHALTLLSVFQDIDQTRTEAQTQHQLARALDIAAGGNGQITAQTDQTQPKGAST